MSGKGVVREQDYETQQVGFKPEHFCFLGL